MNTQLARQSDNEYFLKQSAGRQKSFRLRKYVHYLNDNRLTWDRPNLTAYRDYLLESCSPNTVNAYLSAVRTRYRELLLSNDLRNKLYEQAAEKLRELGQDDNVSNRYAMVSEIETRLKNAVNPQNSKVKLETKQDTIDSDNLRLTIPQCNQLLKQPGIDTKLGIRDTAIIALMLTTGIREGELRNIEVKDLRQKSNGVLGLHVRRGKGKKTRFVPYGNLSWVLLIIDRWLEVAGIEQGCVFRGMRKGGTVRQSNLSTRAIQNITKRYPIAIDGELTTVRPHDLRRTYAKVQYHAGMDLNALRQNLGHASTKTTLSYIGDMDMPEREAKNVFSFDLSLLP